MTFKAILTGLAMALPGAALAAEGERIQVRGEIIDLSLIHI